MPLPKVAKKQTKPLPGITPLACPACDKPTLLLGQWSAHNEKYWLCKECSIEYRWQDELWVCSADGKWNWASEPTQEQLVERVEKMGAIHDLVTVRKKVRQQVMKSLEHLMVKQLAFIKDLPPELQLTWERQLRSNEKWIKSKESFLLQAKQLAIPLCRRCGSIHDNRYKHTAGFMDYCRECEGKVSVENFFRNKGIFGNDDDETILDRIQKSHQWVFDIGVLPDYWYALKVRQP